MGTSSPVSRFPMRCSDKWPAQKRLPSNKAARQESTGPSDTHWAISALSQTRPWGSSGREQRQPPMASLRTELGLEPRSWDLKLVLSPWHHAQGPMFLLLAYLSGLILDWFLGIRSQDQNPPIFNSSNLQRQFPLPPCYCPHRWPLPYAACGTQHTFHVASKRILGLKKKKKKLCTATTLNRLIP